MRGITLTVGIGMAMMAWHTFSTRQGLLFAMSFPWAVLLIIAGIFGEEVQP
jgi:hypothetical protein